jgi:hypothetical protein
MSGLNLGFCITTFFRVVEVDQKWTWHWHSHYLGVGIFYLGDVIRLFYGPLAQT